MANQVDDKIEKGYNMTYMIGTFDTVDNPDFGIKAGSKVQIFVLNINSLMATGAFEFKANEIQKSSQGYSGILLYRSERTASTRRLLITFTRC